MFPFNLDGPQFLAFYAVFALLAMLVHWALYVRPRGGTTGFAAPPLDALTRDPYLIASLRAGAEEAIRVAVVNLVDRGLLKLHGTVLQATGRSEPESVRRELDRVILQRCRFAALSAVDILKDTTVRATAGRMETQLQTQGLLLSTADLDSRNRARRKLLWLLLGVALARMAQALIAGRSNLIFLMIEAALACLAVVVMPRARLTEAGQTALSALQTLLDRLKRRAESLTAGGATTEAILLAAMFGLYALPAAAFPFVEQAYPRPRASDSTGGTDGSSGSSDSSGCGGGSGCGGCGG